MTRSATRTRWCFAAALAACGLVAGCGGPDLVYFSSITSTGQGATLILVWKDSPLDGADRLFVALDRVELLGGAKPVVLLDRREEHDMLSLQNGMRVAFAPRDVPADTYSTMRLTFAPDSAGRHRIEVGGVTHVLSFARPGGETLDLDGPFAFSGGQSLQWVLDLNARLSVLEAAGGWWFDPQVSSTPDDPSRVIRGTVRGPTGLAVAGATVSAQSGGVEASSCRTQGDGSFQIGPLPAGAYTVLATAPGPLASAPSTVQLPSGASSLNLVLGAGVQPGSAVGQAPAGLVAGVVRIYAGGLFLGQTGVDPLTGAFTLPPLAPGLYTFVLQDASGPVSTRANLPVFSGTVSPIVFGP